MDKALNEILADVKLRVALEDFENPILSRIVALDVATRIGMLYRYAQNGAVFTMRWKKDLPPENVHENQVCLTICKRIIDTLPLLVVESSDAPAPTEPDPELEDDKDEGEGEEVDDAEGDAESADAEAKDEAGTADESEKEDSEEKASEETEEATDPASVEPMDDSAGIAVADEDAEESDKDE